MSDEDAAIRRPEGSDPEAATSGDGGKSPGGDATGAAAGSSFDARPSLAGLELPSWVGPRLEAALRQCEKGFDAAWLLSDRTESLIWALREAERRIHDGEVQSAMNLSRGELADVLTDTLGALRTLMDAVPDPEEIDQWASSLDKARTAVRNYLVERQLFKLRLTDETRTSRF